MLRVCNGPDHGKRVLQVHELGSTPVLSPNCVVPFFFFLEEMSGLVLYYYYFLLTVPVLLNSGHLGNATKAQS